METLGLGYGLLMLMSLLNQDVITVGAGYRGLSSAEAAVRLSECGFNARPRSKQSGRLRRLMGIVSEPMMLLLVATGVVYFFLGSTVDAIVILISIIPIGVIEFIQESRTNNAIALLDQLMVDRCKVYRDAELISIETKFIVPGDLVFIAAGDKLPADGVLVDSSGLQVDESILTGESSPVIKTRFSNISSDEAKVFQGTLVVQGEGGVLISATGQDTAYGKLGNLLEKIVTEKTPLQRKIEHLVRGVAFGAVAVAVLVGIVLSFKNGLLPGLLGALTIAISIIPEEFPVVFSVFLIMGVWRLTKEKALVRDMVMVETLGSATVICSDKTGTLTQGTMVLRKIYFHDQLFNVSEPATPEMKQFVTDALLALEQIAVDPIEVELQRFGKAIGLDPMAVYQAHNLRKDGYFDAATKMVHHTWEGEGRCFQYTAGAPELIIDASSLGAVEKSGAQKQYQSLAAAGFRVVGVAKTPCVDSGLFATSGLEFRGLIVMSDELRPGVREAVATCQTAGVRVIMITGDNALTAGAIAREIGLVVNGIIEGSALESATTDELSAMVKTHTIFARVKPEQKYLIVEALQKNGEVVAMTGDGVNDAPALKKANIGIAMGHKGTEVARAAAGMVLLDDNFATIVNAIREGRRIYDNMRRAFSYLLTFHIPIIGLAIIPLLLGQPLFFLPIHIIFLELFCDPAVVLGFERDKLRAGAMREPPRPPSESIIPRRLLGSIIVRGLGMFAVAFVFYLYHGMYLGEFMLGRTLAFVGLVVSELVLIILTHEWGQVKSNRILVGIITATSITLAVIVLHPFLRELFHFSVISFKQLVLVVGMAILIMGVSNRLAIKKNRS
ncbi:MAG: cation-translocating P-type ATPase [Candidatus Magasanikbacteria bacterium]|nr:cation-translocating P-type ATPase [Candidatus Magasanikbacteria bacterium]